RRSCPRSHPHATTSRAHSNALASAISSCATRKATWRSGRRGTQLVSAERREVIELLAATRGELGELGVGNVEARLQAEDAPVVTAHECEEPARVQAVTQQRADRRHVRELGK